MPSQSDNLRAEEANVSVVDLDTTIIPVQIEPTSGSDFSVEIKSIDKQVDDGHDADNNNDDEEEANRKLSDTGRSTEEGGSQHYQQQDAELKYFGPRGHVRHLWNLTMPLIVSEIFQNTLPVVDLAFVGQLSKEDLAAAALATVWFNLWNATMLGFLTAIDTLLSQAFGAGQYEVFGMWAGNGIFIIMCVTAIMGGLLALCAPVMILFGQDYDLSIQAGQFSYRLIPGIFPLYAFKVLTKHLQTQDILLPGVVIGIFANLFNAAANWTLIFQLDMGLDGAPIATTLTRFVEFIAIVIYFYWYKDRGDLSKTWPTFEPRKLLSKNGNSNTSVLGSFMRIAGSGALSMTAEAWSFEVTTILAGLLGTIELDAHIITLSIATFLYLSFPFAIGIAASIRVGQLTGEGRDKDAQRSSLTSYALTAVCQASLIAILLPMSGILGDLFSSAQEVSDLVKKLLPLSCVFMMGDSIQSTNGGILRGLGRQNLVFWLNVIGFWVLAVPVGSFLTFVADIGVEGLWWGMVVGIYSSAFIGCILLKYHVDWHEETVKAKDRITLVGESMHASLAIEPP